MHDNTDTPRTDALWKTHCSDHELNQLSEQLELELKKSQEAYLQSIERDDYLTRELAASKADVERLTESLKHAELWGSFEKQVTAQLEITGLKAEVERLTAMVMEAARLGDSRASNFQDRAERAESLLTQIQAFTEALNPEIK